ncbi:CPBP family intramembrane glutamic endopeptidase [Paenibacillus turpanensis]|uniref:CPBP family intramembrane glutamic endopeptidase n=1 Tax=Paenibacillus turpanensis TaxID=2689078 RepID=UPI001408C645|nr:CPBP family intramembrane glutamic endopeptidase [Paenibacillus turpanensis]
MKLNFSICEAKPYKYLLMLPILIILLHIPFSENAFINGWYYYGLLLLFGLALGRKDIIRYCKPVKRSWSQTAKAAFYLLLTKGVLGSVVLLAMSLAGNSDPQGVLYEYHSVDIFLQQITIVPFVAISEEFFKVLIFLGLYWTFRRLSPVSRASLAVLGASFIFGAIHSFEYAAAAVLPIALGAIPTYYFFIKYKSLFPLIITHFLWDAFFLAGQIEGFGKAFITFLQITSILSIVVIVVHRLFWVNRAGGPGETSVS